MKNNRHPANGKKPITIFGPDFPFAFDDWIEHPAGLGSIPTENLGKEVAIVGAGLATVKVCAAEVYVVMVPSMLTTGLPELPPLAAAAA